MSNRQYLVSVGALICKPLMTIHLNPNLAAPDLPKTHPLNSVLGAALKNRPAPVPIHHQIYWSADHFSLAQTNIFTDATEEEQKQILTACSRNILAEAYYIEKSGMYFAAKMSLLSENTQERMLYSLFAADEATHFSWFTKYISDEEAADYLRNPFLNLLSEVLQNEERITLNYIIQIVLEGWGITHYHALAKDCLEPGLIEVFSQIIKDEGRHHSSGIILCNEREFSSLQITRITEILKNFLAMVQVGPQMIVAEVERVKGHLSRTQKTKLFAELNCETETAKKIRTLKGLIKNTKCAPAIIEELERSGVLRAFTAQECGAIKN